jgi:hypothetical protein
MDPRSRTLTELSYGTFSVSIWNFARMFAKGLEGG